MDKHGEIILYQTKDGKESVEVKLEKETVWLKLNQMTRLFDRDKSVVSSQLNNVFKTYELIKEATVAFFATVQIEGIRSVKRNIEYVNLNAIISVCYRVNFIRGTQFRIWETNILKL